MKTFFFNLLLVVVFLLGISSNSYTAEEIYVSGTVAEYKVDKRIVITDGEGFNHSFAISEDTEVVGDIQENSLVDIEAAGSTATYIGVLDISEFEEGYPEEAPADE